MTFYDATRTADPLLVLILKSRCDVGGLKREDAFVGSILKSQQTRMDNSLLKL